MSQAHSGDTTNEIQNPAYLQPKILLQGIEQNRDQWLELRRGKISSSNVAVVCGVSPWKSPLELWAEWTGKVQDTFRGNRSTQIGLALEPLVASWFAERSGLGVSKADALYGDSELSWLVATPDYIIDGGDPLEIKTANHRSAQKWADGSAPQEYVLQVQIQMRVLRRSRGILSAYLGDVENLADVPVAYDAELFSLVREQCEGFLDCVKRDVPPNAGPGDADILRAITTRNEGAEIAWLGAEGEHVAFLVAEARAAAETAATIRRELEKVEKVKKELENRIKQSMGSATVGVLPDGRRLKLSTIRVSEKTVAGYEYDRMTFPK